MMKTLQYLSVKILNSKNKFIFTVIFYVIISIFFCNNMTYNMGNCFSTTPAPEMLDPRYYLTLQAIQAENRALNEVIVGLRQEIFDLKHQITLNNELSVQQNIMIQDLTLEQKESKVLLLELRKELQQEILKNKKEENITQEQQFGCIR